MKLRTVSDIVEPNAEEMRRHAAKSAVCGECKHFDNQDALKPTITTLVTSLVRDHGWDPSWMGSPENHGICGQSVSGSRGDAMMITGKLHDIAGCQSFRAKSRH